MKLVSFTLEQGNKYYGKIDNNRFFIGSRTTYDGNKGLMNISGTSAQKYDRTAHRPTFKFWADFIHPTAIAEGGLYHTLNTYDRAHFTFSFLQFGAHIPNGDFVLYFRALLKLPLAREYFPDLTLDKNRVCRITDEGIVALESDSSTLPLLDYLNPSLKEIEDTEIIQAARLVHWAQNDEAHRHVQVETGIANFKSKMVSYAKQYNLNGASDVICLMVADIRHQGRAKSPAIIAALQSANPLNALLDIGDPKYHERITVLKREINSLIRDGTFGHLNYDAHKNDFV